MAHPDKAKITKTHIRRSIIWVVVLAAIGYGFYWLLGHDRDPDPLLPGFHSVGDIAVIEVKDSGSQAEIIKPDGGIMESPDYTAGSTDHNIVWRPDGNRIFFESDRYNQEPHVFRWNPDRQIVERRTLDKRAKGPLDFDAPGLSKPSPTALMTAGGTVVEINPNTGDTKQLLPPSKRDAAAPTSSEGGQQSQIEAQYQQLGNAFVRALWGNNKQLIGAVMRRDNGGQSFILQDMTSTLVKPKLIALGDHIGLSVMKNGAFVFTVLGYQLPDWDQDVMNKYMKNGKVVPPYKNLIGAVGLDGNIQAIGEVPNEGPNSRTSFGDPAVSPDNNWIALSVSNNDKPVGIAVVPLAAGGWPHAALLAKGDFSKISWSPNSDSIVAIMTRKDGGHDVVTIGKQGDLRNLTNGKGDYLEAVYSPQTQ